jgi:hypothetical protein
MRFVAGLVLCAATACGGGATDSTSSTGGGGGEATDGRWRPASVRAPALDEEQLAVLAELRSLGYADATREAPELVSVTRYDEARAEAGLNFYTSGHATAAFLTDMRGNLLHTWRYDDERWPDLPGAETAAGRATWRRAFVYPNGDVLAIYEGLGMLKLDRDSKRLWRYPGQAHHDMDVLADGTIWTLAREAEVIPRINEHVPCMDDFLVELSPQGRELRRVSVLACLENGEQTELLARMRRERELFHTNSIEVLDGALAERAPAFAAGNVLISSRLLSAVMVVDVEREAVVWSLTAGFKKQHHPRMLASGHMLIFDNMGRPGASTVFELDPLTRTPTWAYRGTDRDPFFSKFCGTTYRLPRGNTLITESDAGRAFEVTPDGEIVWEFYSPHRGGENGELIATLFDLQRFPADAFEWLER